MHKISIQTVLFQQFRIISYRDISHENMVNFICACVWKFPELWYKNIGVPIEFAGANGIWQQLIAGTMEDDLHNNIDEEVLFWKWFFSLSTLANRVPCVLRVIRVCKIQT